MTPMNPSLAAAFMCSRLQLFFLGNFCLHVKEDIPQNDCSREQDGHLCTRIEGVHELRGRCLVRVTHFGDKGRRETPGMQTQPDNLVTPLRALYLRQKGHTLTHAAPILLNC